MMSVTTAIYIQSAEEIEKLCKSLEEILQVQFRLHEGIYTQWGDRLFTFFDPSAHIEGHLEVNEYVIDDFTTLDFQYILSIHSRSNVPRTREPGQIGYAKKVFQQLRASGKYPLLLLHNYEEVLDEYIPDDDTHT